MVFREKNVISVISCYICIISVNVQALLGEHVEKEDAKVGLDGSMRQGGKEMSRHMRKEHLLVAGRCWLLNH